MRREVYHLLALLESVVIDAKRTKTILNEHYLELEYDLELS